MRKTLRRREETREHSPADFEKTFRRRVRHGHGGSAPPKEETMGVAVEPTSAQLRAGSTQKLTRCRLPLNL